METAGAYPPSSHLLLKGVKGQWQQLTVSKEQNFNVAEKKIVMETLQLQKKNDTKK